MIGSELIAIERKRQIHEENWTAAHDDAHERGELAVAAACYATLHTDATISCPDDGGGNDCPGWPWDRGWLKPGAPIRNLVKAGALIAAEIDRLQRAERRADEATRHYRKKPVIIEARRLTAENLEELESWSRGSIKGTRLPREERELEIQTMEGDMRACIGDWVIKGTENEFYPCKDVVFRKVYEPVITKETK